jgi:hypothetical protein
MVALVDAVTPPQFADIQGVLQHVKYHPFVPLLAAALAVA